MIGQFLWASSDDGEAEAPPAPGEKAARVLLIEDDEIDAGLVRRRLAGEAVEIVHARFAGDGIRRLGAGAFDVVILDLNLPDSWASETLKTALDAAGNVPIIAVSGNELSIHSGRRQTFPSQFLTFVPKDKILHPYFGKYVVFVAALADPAPFVPA
ncbi:MAG: response regulator [Geminicoccaceae bacterium]|nr:response regulator [Geminicoccaceae bacterium]